MFIHCLYIHLEFYSAVSKEGVLILQILHSLRNCLLCFAQTGREQLAYPHSEKNIVRKYAHFYFEGNRFLPQFVMDTFYCFAGCLVIIALKVYPSKHIPSQQNLSPKAHCLLLQKKIDGVHISA